VITREFVIADMHCAHCAMHIDGAVEDLPGVDRCDANYAKSRATVTYDPARVTPAAIVAAIQSAGYGARLAEGGG
jgi:copper chaperone CopZ